MRWTLGLLLLGAAGCGYHQTKMVACPAPGCAVDYAEASPEGLPAAKHVASPTKQEALPPPAVEALPPPAVEPLPEPAPLP